MDWHELVIGLFGILITMVGWIVSREIKRTDNIERRQNNLVTAEQFKAHEDQDNRTFERMTEAHAEMQKTVTMGFADVTKAINGVHIDMLQRALDSKTTLEQR